MRAHTSTRSLPVPLRKAVSLLRRLFVYSGGDSSEYWRRRAAEPGQAAVLWKNQDYNALYRLDQTQIMAPWIRELPPGARILDIGCGIGVVSRMIMQQRDDVMIDAVDFAEMIEVARVNCTADDKIQFIASSAEDYFAGPEHYELILSSGCYSAIRDIRKLEAALVNGARMLKRGGIMLLIDPFHRWNYLARAKYASRDVIALLRREGLKLMFKSGVLFWPFREWLANSSADPQSLAKHYRRGERLRRALGPHFWADYKILVLRKAP